MQQPEANLAALAVEFEWPSINYLSDPDCFVNEEVIPIEAHHWLNALTFEVQEQTLVETTERSFSPQRTIRPTDNLVLGVLRKCPKHALDVIGCRFDTKHDVRDITFRRCLADGLPSGKVGRTYRPNERLELVD